MAELSSGQITGKITHAQSEIERLEAEKSELALSAVSGDETAVARIADIRATIRQIEADIPLLESARLTAERNEARADEERRQAYRDRHYQIARERAKAIVDLAVVIDGLVADIKKRLSNLNDTEQEIWAALREAGASPSSGRVGQRGLSRSAIDLLSRFANGTDKFDAGRPVAAVARDAWGHLLEPEGRGGGTDD